MTQDPGLAYSLTSAAPRSEHTASLRAVNNAGKAYLIQWSVGLARSLLGLADRGDLLVTELACGRLGDLAKWTSAAGPARLRLLGLDIAPGAVDEARRRLAASARPGDLVEVHLEDGRPLPASHLVSMQMALHYFCGSDDEIDRLLARVAAGLQEGGLFVASYFDAWSLLSARPDAATSAGASFCAGRATASVDARTASPDHAGTPVHFRMDGSVGQDASVLEYLVPVRRLLRIALRHHLHLVRVDPLPRLVDAFHVLHPDRCAAILARASPLDPDQLELAEHYTGIVLLKRTVPGFGSSVF